MSASLVGSEMCIRDSCLKCSRARTQRPAAGTRHSEERRARFAAIPRAVSYTHLTLPTICSV
eukprot:4286236-Alexandrium_andersonii.AAC.1